MNRKIGLYLLISCALHGALIVVLYLISGSSVIPTNFLVLGAHSKEHLDTLYKPMRHIIPFVPARQTQIQQRQTPKPETPKSVTQEKAPEQKKTIIEQEKKKPLVPDKIVPKKIIEPEKKNQPKAPEKKSAEPTKKETPAPVEPKKPTHTSNTLQDQQIQLPLPHIQEQTAVFTQHIQKEISRLWRPPVGVPKGTECTVRFTVTKKGKVHHFDFLKRSDIIIYDLSVTRIAHKFEFDKSLWGKTFTIDFRQ